MSFQSDYLGCASPLDLVEKHLEKAPSLTRRHVFLCRKLLLYQGSEISMVFVLKLEGFSYSCFVISIGKLC